MGDLSLRNRRHTVAPASQTSQVSRLVGWVTKELEGVSKPPQSTIFPPEITERLKPCLGSANCGMKQLSICGSGNSSALDILTGSSSFRCLLRGHCTVQWSSDPLTPPRTSCPGEQDHQRWGYNTVIHLWLYGKI